MCKSHKIYCEKPRNMVLKILFRAHLPERIFLVVCSIYKRNSWLSTVHRMVYFLLFKKMAKKSFSSNLSHLAQKQSTQSFKKEIKTRKKELYFFENYKKCRFLQKLYKGLKLNVENAKMSGIGSPDFKSIFMPFRPLTPNPCNF